MAYKNSNNDNLYWILEVRKPIITDNLSLNRTAVNSGVKNLDKIHNVGYKGLYNGETAR